MKNLVIGCLAHVDAGKTTFSEQILCHAGVLRKAGRVDHGDAFLDAHPLERQRGITIFSDQAVFQRNCRWFWVDTPGHADFSTEMERAVSILDCALLIVDGTQGVQSHTEAIWKLLDAYRVPVFLFINKADRPTFDLERALAQLRSRLSSDIVLLQNIGAGVLPEDALNAAAERDEELFERVMSGTPCGEALDAMALDALQRLTAERKLFPAFWGSALTDSGVAECLASIEALAQPRNYPDAPFSGLVYRVRPDPRGGRVAFFKVLSGTLSARESFDVPGGNAKATELRLYSGQRFEPIERAEAGMLCAVPGLDARPGDYIGSRAGERNAFRVEPMLAASVIGDGRHTTAQLLEALQELEAEDPLLRIAYNAATGAIDAHVMGAIQLEVLIQLARERYGMDIAFGPMRVLYMETITAPVVGIGHYEPLRHYAEVHVRLWPGERGSGVQFTSSCHVDELSLHWQRLIETHVFEKEHRGVLIGAPLTDVRVELLHGRAHLKHTEGGDFRQATYRAIRNALMRTQSVLLEPICRFRVRAPQALYGRVTGSLQKMQAQVEPPITEEGNFELTGEAVLSSFAAFAAEFPSITHGLGSVSFHADHFEPCRDAETVVREAAYRPTADDSPDSVFCAHGAGFVVPWDRVREYAHCPIEPDEP